MVRTLVLSTLLASSLANAQVYRTTDSNGNVIFTDTPPPGGAEEVKLNPTNTTGAQYDWPKTLGAQSCWAPGRGGPQSF